MLEDDLQLNAIAQLSRAQAFVFKLTGSRRLLPSHVTLQSDWDFYVQESHSVRVYLETCGFSLKDRESYLDSDSIDVYTKDNVDVQVRLNAVDHERKQGILLQLPEQARFRLLSKTQRSKAEIIGLWNAL
jgi:hypothetical protein